MTNQDVVDDNALSGRGYHLDLDAQVLHLLYEVDDMARNQQGQPAPAGCQVKIHLGKESIIGTPEDYKALAENVRRVVAPVDQHHARLLTWTEYNRHYGFVEASE